MKGLSLNTKLLIGISVLVVSSGMIIALVGSYHYSRALQEAAVAQGEYLSQSLALEATDMILINDIVALQKLIHHQQAINNPSVAYVFIERDGRILAHTFEGGFPVALIAANQPRSASMGHHQSIEADSGDRYLDFAWPIFDGRAGTLRLGLSGQAIQKRVLAYWVKMIVSALVVLAAALVAGAVIARKISGPVTRLAETADQIDAGKLDVAIDVTGADEIGRLGLAFSRMLTRIRDYTDRLEKTTSDLDRAYRQTKSSFDILQKISTQTSLKDMCAYLFEQFQEIVTCSRFMLVFFSPNQNDLIVFADGTLSLHASDTALALLKPIRSRDDIFFARLDTLPPEIRPESFQNTGRIAVFPLTAETNPLGALMVACPGRCQCNNKDLEVIDLILHEATGVLRRAIWHEAEKHQPGTHRKQMEPFEGMVGKAPEINIIFHIIKDIAPTDVSVLIQGQSGTGKELVAHAIHNLSERREKPFIVINCSAYPATLLESELFGHEKGAFTGAVRRKIGRFEQADGGTVFLDEIGEISLSAQIKLLRVLQTHQFERLGGEATLSVDVRVISATNRDLLQEVKNGNFREDLYYRLKVIPITLPPLRERRNDVPLLARYFLKRFSTDQSKPIGDFSTEAMRMLLDYHWPGNIRELENTIEHAVVLAKGGAIEIPDFPASLRELEGRATASAQSMSENEARLLHDVLEECQWNKKKAARLLGISRNTLYRKLKKYRIQPPTLH